MKILPCREGAMDTSIAGFVHGGSADGSYASLKKIAVEHCASSLESLPGQKIVSAWTHANFSDNFEQLISLPAVW